MSSACRSVANARSWASRRAPRGVEIELSGDGSLRAQYLVGCDGGRSLVRKAAGIDFPGWDPTTSWMIAEVEMEEEPQVGMRPEGGGIGPVNRDERRRALPGGAGRAGDRACRRTRPARSQRGAGRRLRHRLRRAQPHVDLALHRHDPPGGVVSGRARAARRRRRPRARRRPAGRASTSACKMPSTWDGSWPRWSTGPQPTACSTPTTPSDIRSPPACCRTPWRRSRSTAVDERSRALRDTALELLSMDEPRRAIAAMISGLDVRYDLGEGHPLCGRRMPDLDVQTSAGPTRVFALLHDARPVLLDLGATGGFDLSPWADRVRLGRRHLRRRRGSCRSSARSPRRRPC